jgi:hypothetical protein
VAYTLQSLYLLPMRAYKYKKRAWHYFLFDLCYYVTILVRTRFGGDELCSLLA